MKMNKLHNGINEMLLSYHIHSVRCLRRRACQLIDTAVPCTDQRLVHISNQITAHGLHCSRHWTVLKREACESDSLTTLDNAETLPA